MNNVGDYIKQLRTSRGLTQEELGDIIGVKKAAVQKWESGLVQNLKRTTIQQLAELFDVNPASFINGDTPATPAPVLRSKSKKAIFAENLIRLMDDRNANDYQIMSRMRVTLQDVKNWRLGKAMPDEETLELIADYLKVPLDELTEDNSDVFGPDADDLSDKERRVALAYRENPNMQESVDKLLGLSDDDCEETIVAARGNGLPRKTTLRRRPGSGNIADAPDYDGGRR